MGKELTPLKALEKILNKRCGYCPFNHEDMNDEICEECDKCDDVVETKLKDYEELEEQLGFDPTIFKQDFKTLMKKHKALEVIKEKFVITAYIRNSKTVEEYNKQLKQTTFRKDYERRKLTQEEFNLLKEVLI